MAETTPAPRIRCGDIVRHRAEGHTWLVAWADYTTGELGTSGYPIQIVNIGDVMLLKAASDADHEKWVDRWLMMVPGQTELDVRQKRVKALYRPDPRPGRKGSGY